MPSGAITVELTKGPKGGFGISVDHVSGGNYITRIKEGLPAEEEGTLQVGMELISVGGVSIHGLDKAAALAALRGAAATAGFVVLPAQPGWAEQYSAKKRPQREPVPAQPSYDDHGGSDVLHGGMFGESSTDPTDLENLAWVEPPANTDGYRRWLQLRPKVDVVIDPDDDDLGVQVSETAPYRVESVEPQSNAEKAGVVPGDLICMIGGKSFVSKDRADLLKALSMGTSKAIKLRLARVDVGGLCVESQRGREEMLAAGYRKAPAIGVEEPGHILDLSQLDELDHHVYAEEDYYPEGGQFYEDE